jgi:hypothetical protein
MHFLQNAHATHAMLPATASDIAVPILPATAALPAVAIEPATAVLATVAAELTTPALARVAADPATAVLATVAAEPATAELAAVAPDPATAVLAVANSESTTLPSMSRDLTTELILGQGRSIVLCWRRDDQPRAHRYVSSGACRGVGLGQAGGGCLVGEDRVVYRVRGPTDAQYATGGLGGQPGCGHRDCAGCGERDGLSGVHAHPSA